MRMKWTCALLLAGAATLTLALGFPDIPAAMSGETGHEETAKETAKETGDHDHEEQGHEESGVSLSPEQMEASGITTVPVKDGALSVGVEAPGRIVADSARIAAVTPVLSGKVIEVKKNLGQAVAKGEVMAIIESREMADAAAEYRAAKNSTDLAKSVYEREKRLWERKITAEQDYLAAKNDWQEARIHLDLASQKLQSLGASAKNASRFYALKSPLSGMVTERSLTLGEIAGAGARGFMVADLSVLWAELSLTPDMLTGVTEGQAALVKNGKRTAEGKLIFVSPVLDNSTRSAKAVVEFPNAAREWRPGDYADVSLVTTSQKVALIVPQDAIQKIDGKDAVFVRTRQGFERRDIVTGRKDGRNAEILSGLSAGEKIAAGNVFILKAEGEKSEAGHEH